MSVELMTLLIWAVDVTTPPVIGRTNVVSNKKRFEQTTWRATGTRICASTVSASTTDRKNVEPESRMDNPVRTIEEENTGQNNTRMNTLAYNATSLATKV